MNVVLVQPSCSFLCYFSIVTIEAVFRSFIWELWKYLFEHLHFFFRECWGN
uniref:Uncharacterized protein n=1 Tax=uncultured marine virus TaxID=186617 RepID=A0A0F7L7Q9_9VIRU|nr:hypothetical protein [uncultured marine virus]